MPLAVVVLLDVLTSVIGACTTRQGHAGVSETLQTILSGQKDEVKAALEGGGTSAKSGLVRHHPGQ